MSRRARVSERGNGSSLKVRKNRRVALHYRVSLTSGKEIDSSWPSDPMEIVCGRGDTILGLEKRILGMESGDHRQFIIPPEEAFGHHDDNLRRTFSKETLHHSDEIAIGDTVPLQEKGTSFLGRVIRINDGMVTADFNHPLAGESLHYEIEILTVNEIQPDTVSP